MLSAAPHAGGTASSLHPSRLSCMACLCCIAISPEFSDVNTLDLSLRLRELEPLGQVLLAGSPVRSQPTRWRGPHLLLGGL